MEPSEPTPQQTLLTPPSVQPSLLPPRPELARASQSEQLRVSASESLQLATTHLELQPTPPPKPLPLLPSEYHIASQQIAKLPTPPKPVLGPISRKKNKVQPAALQAPQQVPQLDPLPVPPSESMQGSPLAAALPASPSDQLEAPPVALLPVQPPEQLTAPQGPLPVPPSESILPVQPPKPLLAPSQAELSLRAAVVLSVQTPGPVIAPSDLLSEPSPAAWPQVQPPKQLLSPQTVALQLLQPEPLQATPMPLQEFPSEPPLARQPGVFPEPLRPESRPDLASEELAGQLPSSPKSLPSSGELLLHAKIPSLPPSNPIPLPVLDIAWDDRNPLKIWVERAQDLLDKSEPIPFPPPIGHPPVPNAIQQSPVLLLRQELLNGCLGLQGKDSQQTETGKYGSTEIGYSGSAVHRGRSFITYKLHQNHCTSRESLRQQNSGSMGQQVITTSYSTCNTSTNWETCNTRRNPVRRSSDQSYLRRGYRGHTNRR
ncbi:proline-rich protein 36-like [Lytechinus variegatus]|uniref:proline-rich protein 36-like n=1 Tax=Lytechinus variegatus TaxID=7654 RepID=UPI001BB2022D|nr:proline-rich protein 36-like [Lytechinus variegatus]